MGFLCYAGLPWARRPSGLPLWELLSVFAGLFPFGLCDFLLSFPWSIRRVGIVGLSRSGVYPPRLFSLSLEDLDSHLPGEFPPSVPSRFQKIKRHSLVFRNERPPFGFCNGICTLAFFSLRLYLVFSLTPFLRKFFSPRFSAMGFYALCFRSTAFFLGRFLFLILPYLTSYS